MPGLLPNAAARQSAAALCPALARWAVVWLPEPPMTPHERRHLSAILVLLMERAAVVERLAQLELAPKRPA